MLALESASTTAAVRVVMDFISNFLIGFSVGLG